MRGPPQSIATGGHNCKSSPGHGEDYFNEQVVLYPQVLERLDLFFIGHGIVLGDVSGKGTPAALIMATSRTIVRSEAKCGAEIHFAACYRYPMSDMLDLKLGVDGFFGSDSEYDGETVDDSASNMVSLNPGVIYLMDNGMDVGLDIHYVLMGQNTSADWGLGLWLGWSSM